MKLIKKLMPSDYAYEYTLRCPKHPRHWVDDTGDFDDSSDFCGCCDGECDNYLCGHPVGYYSE